MDYSNQRPPRSVSSLKLGYHYLVTYFTPVLILVPLLAVLAGVLSTNLTVEGLRALCIDNLRPIALSVTFIAMAYLVARPRPVYLVNFACSKPSDAPLFSREFFITRAAELKYFTTESLEFQRRILERSGIGNATYFPKSVATMPPSMDVASARSEAEMVMFGAVEELLAKTKVEAREVDVLVVNCSLFCPTPSLAEMIINRFGLREDVMSYHLSGMGCSAGLLSVDLAKNLLKVHRNSRALIVSTETLAVNGYQGNNRAMLVTNCLFRVGGTAILLSNRRCDRGLAKYRLAELVRTHRGADDESYACVSQEEDDDGKIGIALSKDLMTVAAEALKSNITTLGPRVLPVSEQLLFVATLAGRKLLRMKKLSPYVPDFKLAFEHFCIHAGGRALLDAIQKSLSLDAWHMEPSRMTLYRFGNTSSSSLWYELAYSEAKGRIRSGDRVWQLAFGSGFKCNSLVWKALRKIEPKEDVRPWLEEIHEFPVDVPKVMPINVELPN